MNLGLIRYVLRHFVSIPQSLVSFSFVFQW